MLIWDKQFTIKTKKGPDSTWNLYSNTARLHIIPAIGNIPLQQLQTSDLQRLYNSKLENGRVDGSGGLSSRMIHLMHQVISGALKQAVKEQLITRNVADAVELPKLRYKEIRPLTLEEVKRFLEAARSHRLYTAFLVELGTGLRRGELLALRWDDVNLETGVIRVRQTLSRIQKQNGPRKTELVFQEPKTKQARRSIPLPGDILKELRAHKARQAQEKLALGPAYQDNGLVFCTEDGRPLDPRNFTKRYEAILKKAGLEHVSFHNLRHTFATLLLEAGEHPKIVQELLGHTKISVTLDIYTHVADGLKEKAASKLNDMLNLNKEKTVHQDG